MCRLVAYLGKEVLLEDILVKPVNSLVSQSLHARETEMPTNGDGFGLGWYNPQVSNAPALFTSIQPAWNDRNLLHLAGKITAPCFFSHVRAASAGGVTQYNCHPFLYQDWLFMHNGGIHDFVPLKRHLRHLLDDDIYHWVKGQTDSEHAFGLFLQLAKGRDLTQIELVIDVLRETITTINQLADQYSMQGPSNLNFVLSDGKRLVACRYNSLDASKARSLHYSLGGEFLAIDGKYHMQKSSGSAECLLVTSEKLTDFEAEWHDVPANHFLSVDEKKQFKLTPIYPE